MRTLGVPDLSLAFISYSKALTYLLLTMDWSCFHEEGEREKKITTRISIPAKGFVPPRTRSMQKHSLLHPHQTAGNRCLQHTARQHQVQLQLASNREDSSPVDFTSTQSNPQISAAGSES